MYSWISRALWSQEVWTAVVLRNGGLLMGHIQHSSCTTLITRGVRHCRSFVWRVHPSSEGPSLLSPLLCHRAQHHTAPSHGPWHRCWVKHCSGPREASSALRARCVAQVNLEASARQATIPVTTDTAARVFIAGYTPPTTATKQMQESEVRPILPNNSSAAFPNNFLFLTKPAISHPSWMWFLCQMSPDWQKFIFH